MIFFHKGEWVSMKFLQVKIFHFRKFLHKVMRLIKMEKVSEILLIQIGGI